MTLIDKLEKKASQYLQYKIDAKTLYDLRYFGGNANGFISAIDIVKHHKCIWKGVYNYHQESTCYALSCGNEYFDNYMGEDVDIFKYCPYCGGEIEFTNVG